MIRPNYYAVLRVLAVLCTIGLLALHQYLPPKIMPLYPLHDRYGYIYGPDKQGKPTFGWIDQDKNHFWCNYQPGDLYSCGWSLMLGPGQGLGVDLSTYDGLNIVLHYSGDSPRIRPYLRDFNAKYCDIDKMELSSKVMSTTIRAVDLTKSIFVPFNEFSVAEWWVTEFNIARENAGRSLKNVTYFAVDFNTHGYNQVSVEKIEAIGDQIKKETLYLIIIAAWMSVVLIEIISRLYSLYRNAKAEELRLNNLTQEYQSLEATAQKYEALSTTDTLTGVMNRAGIQHFLKRVFDKDPHSAKMGLLIFDVDHFKKINDQFGHDGGDYILKQIASIISAAIRQSDVFGRWGGEEFVLICPNIHHEQLLELAEKLRKAVAEHEFALPPCASGINTTAVVTVSIGVATINPGESFDAAFKRADNALYQAKHNGRNCVWLAQTE